LNVRQLSKYTGTGTATHLITQDDAERIREVRGADSSAMTKLIHQAVQNRISTAFRPAAQ